MVIVVTERGSDAYYDEVVNVMLQYRSLLKKPEMKLADMIRNIRIYLIVCAVLEVLMLVMGIVWGFDALTISAILLLLLVVVLCANTSAQIRRTRNALAGAGASTLTIDETGVELSRQGAQVVKLAWENVAFVRTFSESIAVLSKSLPGIVIGIDGRYREEVLREMRENHPDVRLIVK